MRLSTPHDLQGKLEVRTLAGTGAAAESAEDVVQKVPFLLLSLDLPPARLFQDAMERNIIPQVCARTLCHCAHVPEPSESSLTYSSVEVHPV